MRHRSVAIALGVCIALSSLLAAAESPGTPAAAPGASTGRDGGSELPQWGGRLAYVDARGDLKARLRSDPDGAWVTVARDVQSFQLLDWSLAVLNRDGTLFAAEGALDAPLAEIARNVCAYQKTLTRLGVLQCDGTFLVRETPSMPVRRVATGVESFQVMEDRAAFRAADGGLWVHEGGVLADFQKVADAVDSFQLERGWIGFLRNRALMLAEGSLERGALSFREIARDVAEFEMEVRVEPGNFQKTLRLAVVTREGVLKIASGGGSGKPIQLEELDRGSICGIAWAGGRLGYLGAEGLKVADFGEGNWPERLDSLTGLGPIASFRITREGAVLFDGETGSRLFEWRGAGGDVEPDSVAGRAAEPAIDRSARIVLVASGELEMDASGGAARGVESSSMRPAFLRRPVRGIPSRLAVAGPVRQFSHVPEARAVEGHETGSGEIEVPAVEQAPVTSTSTLVTEAAQATLQNGVPLYQLNYPPLTDHFYTTKASDRDIAKSLGFTDQGIAAYVEPSQVAGTNPFWRFYSGGQTDHFYTTSSAEFNYVVANGFTYESVEGYLYASRVAGTVPLYRLSRWYPSNNDLDHFYTVDDTAKSNKISQGWTYDGVAGYVWPAAAAPTQGPPLYRWYASGTTDHFYSTTNWGSIGGFVQQGIAAYMAPGPGPNALPFRRFYNASITEHFYTTNAAEAAYVLANGWVEEGTGEGYLFTSSQPNTVPFYRLYWCNGLGDCDHMFTAWASEKDGLIAMGWILDGVMGYVGMPPGSPPPLPVPPAQDNAAFVSQSVPALMTIGKGSVVSVTMKNNGTTTWSTAAGYQLASWSPQDNTVWGVSRVSLPANVAPNTNVTFSFTVTPATAGTKTMQWRMVRLGGAFGTASQNVSVVVDKNPRLIIGLTPWADNYIQYFNSLGGSVPAQTSVRWKPYTGIECPTPFSTTSACNPGIPAWARDNRPNIDPINPCVTPILITETFLANHQRRNIGPDVNGRTWTPVGKSTYGPINWNPCDLQVYQITGFCHAPTQLLFWLVQADPVLAVGSGTYCPTDKKATTRYSQGRLSREILPGEVTPDSYAMVPNWPPDFARLGVQPNPWRAYVPAGHQVTGSDQSAAKGDVFWINVPNVGNSIPILGATLFGGGSGPHCFSEYCVPINDRAMAQLTESGWAITITGYMTGNDSIFQNTADALSDLGALQGTGESNPTVNAIQNWLVQNNVMNPVFYGHSLGAMDAAVLYQRGFGSQMVLFSAPWVLPYTSLLQSSSELVAGPRPVIVYGGVNDTIANMPPGFSGCTSTSNQCRILNGVNLLEIDTGSGFITFSNPHDRCKYQPYYFGAGQCPF